MVDVTGLWKNATDKGRWSSRVATFTAKVKATKAVWFPPKPEKTGKKVASTAKKATKKSTGAAKNTGAKRTAAAKRPSSAKKVTSPVGRKRTSSTKKATS